MQFLIYSPSQLNHELTCYNNSEGHEGEEQHQDEDWGGVSHEGKAQNMEENTREVRSRRMGKYLVVCVHALVGKNFFLVQFKQINNRDSV